MTTEVDQESRIQREFEEFHAKNEDVYRLYLKFAMELVSRGRKKIGIALLTERIRWEIMMETHGDEFKINNNFRSRYARKLMAEYPGLAGMFETRALKS